ncbi:hypothetical protein N474_11155 [Pseudoalteromonas luteoviolacea CPMOR-2]|uniref:Uncharacterized protein n=1 Tax=Pseudoalteromonas luteoviolacea DSM 6061 TaxID=1365250 RepID=A0A166V9Q1_9GAMM|nr:hypothetical protein [Pseudoalteromonas luteoviolacea]KZN32400.1 hypothetical protein N475_22220 [Pseudoalteromonas luteoviolacea DSM 6061]KZN56702.1 hypothetical protein N474_11155 [Pseudoalteromonas luteoviolacea CPMOR-2]MBE0386088.1 hypothetical protein [Pseudoalteromonas luteoviolacea DSM 6061]
MKVKSYVVSVVVVSSVITAWIGYENYYLASDNKSKNEISKLDNKPSSQPSNANIEMKGKSEMPVLSVQTDLAESSNLTSSHSEASVFDFPLRPLEDLHDLRELEREYDFIREQLEATQAVEMINQSNLSEKDIASLKRTYTHLNKVIKRIGELDLERIEAEFDEKYGENAYEEDLNYVRSTVAEALEKRRESRKEWQREIDAMTNAVKNEQEVQ